MQPIDSLSPSAFGFMRSSCSVQSSSCIGFFFFLENESDPYRFFFFDRIKADPFLSRLQPMASFVRSFLGRNRHAAALITGLLSLALQKIKIQTFRVDLIVADLHGRFGWPNSNSSFFVDRL